jgi:ankyrin repeat protein
MLATAGVAASLVLASAPAHAQFSASFEFLKAVTERDVGTAARLISNNPSIINFRNADTGDTALHIAIKRSDAPWMRFLLDRGANPNARDANGDTALHIAATRGYTDGAVVLLAFKADINAPNDNGETPLIKAVQARQEAIVKLLMEAKADVTIADNASGFTAVEHAERDRRASRILSMLKNGVRPE